ncbi:MAG TPA: AI-2E family transporter [Gemmatimonadales bacterium]|nr:AI-2E family transporter [Gemmatimonadales bacterium]
MTQPIEAERRRGFPLGWVLLAVIVVALAVRTIDVLLVLFLAVILAVYLDAVSGFLQRRLDIPATLALAAALMLTVGAVVGVVFLIAPAVASQVQDFATNLPRFLSDLDQSISRLFRSVPVLRRGVTEGSTPGLLATSLNEIFGVLRGALVPYLKGGVELIIEGVSVFVMALYLARSPGIYLDGLIALVPPSHRPLSRVILNDLRVTLRAWVVGQIIAMVLLAALTTLGLWILGVPYFLAFGVFAGVAAIVPFFGTLLSTLVPALFALGVFGLPKALAVAALGVGVHLIEANFVAPVVMERQVNLPPVITIAGVLLIGKLFGLAGLIVAVPILAFVMVLLRHILLGQVYGDVISEVKPSGTVPVQAEPTITTQPVTP